jgi:cytosine/adenosine deaminase-related metal-dependent hydrolase
MERGVTPSSPDATLIDGGNRLLFPGMVDMHAHHDKCMLGLPWYRRPAGLGLQEKMANERRLRLERDINFHEQTTRAVRASIAAGTTHLRSFCNVDTDIHLRGFEGIMKTREDFRDVLTMEVIAFPQSGMLIRPGTVELMEEALRNGADVVGGIDPCLIERDPIKHLDVVFGLAEKYNADVDIHMHEMGDLGAFSMELIAERTKVLGWQGRVVIGHIPCLGGVDEAYQGRLIDLLAENRIAVTSNGPGGNRPSPPIKRLRDAGVVVNCGSDNARDPWGPWNVVDMLLRVYIVAHRNAFSADEEIEMVLDIATNGGAATMRLEDYGLSPGCSADFFVMDGETHVEAILERPPRWLVVKRGRIVARDGECLV